jgi:hypothetical protein
MAQKRVSNKHMGDALDFKMNRWLVPKLSDYLFQSDVNLGPN